MRLALNLVNVAIAAVLMDAVAAAMPMEFIKSIFRPSNDVVEYYEGQPLRKQGVFGMPKLKVTGIFKQVGEIDYLKGKLGRKHITITCIPKAPMTEAASRVISMYEQLKQMAHKKPRDGAKYIAHSEGKKYEFDTINRKCYISKTSCEEGYRAYYRHIEQQEDYDERYLLSGLFYDFSDEYVCFDAKGNLALIYLDRAMSLEEMGNGQRDRIGRAIVAKIEALYKFDIKHFSSKKRNKAATKLAQSLTAAIAPVEYTAARGSSTTSLLLLPPPPYNSRDQPVEQ
ncbi:hypothetical protein SYNPS1DRAFT_30749 [Syncephalis pseudoplumigaleata]|uniref:Uncharacterized protein n=1 Tax=Syncephalis pseudoplumigaleata TaxID=1712513 RepID=A0A4P9YUI9_9FUNG|nr:hypothetical protein SYNPS1DRAFT_30749 [Syncephalis pseudoplumigaleata]|eukprot:RKP23504.1 hypothetical protein SYNPS1DRAFT_30749 [Syncephalis pseudoplumigaleata]